MNRRLVVLFVLLLLSVFTGYLLSKASLVGRAGISLFYTQYKFLKVWWQAGLLVLVVWLLLFYLQLWAHKKLPARKARRLFVSIIFLCSIGLYFTYLDFHHNTAHRWLGERFHLGGYLFWMGCMLTALLYLTQGRNTHTFTDEKSAEETPPA